MSSMLYIKHSKGLNTFVIKSLAMITRTRLLRIYFSLVLVTTLLLGLRLLIRTDSAGSGLQLEISLGRISLLIPVMFFMLMIGWLTYRAWRRPIWQDGFGARLSDLLERENLYIMVILSAASVILIGGWIYQIGSVIQDSYFQGYFSKAAPFLLWGIANAAITLLFVRFYRFGTELRVFQSQSTVFKASGVAFGLLLLVAIFIGLTGLGMKPDLVGWGDPGTPALPAQVLLLVALSVAALVISETLGKRWTSQLTGRARSAVDGLIFVFLWLLAIWLWQAQSLTPAHFAPEPVAPNFEYYPYSDAANYEVSAQELLIGMGFGSDVRRPIYSLFLALSQLASGIGYTNILMWQIPLLGLIPPLLYLLGKALHSRLAGGMIAGLALFHEVNAIRLSSLVNVSHAKLLMSDLPTALGVIAFTVVLVYWWKAPQRHRAYPLLAGGILALTMLVRIQVVVLLPGALLPLLIAFWDRKRQFIMASVLILVGMGCVLIPWLWRGQQASGKLSFAEAAQESQIGLMGARYTLNPDSALGAALPGENSSQYSQRMFSSAMVFIITHPSKALEFITAHLLHNQLSTLLTLPPSYASGVNVPYLETNFSRNWQQCCSVSAYVRDLPYWSNWEGQLPGNALPALLFNLLLVSVGLGAAWKRQGAVGLLPIWLSLCYALGNSLVRSSGWRFNLPVDWVGLFYYGLGLVQIMFWGAMFFANRMLPRNQRSENEIVHRSSVSFPWKQTLLLGIVFFLISAAIPLTEAVIPNRYPEGWLEQAMDEPYLEQELYQAGIPASLSDFASENGLKLLYGRALFPRYYGPTQGIPGNEWPAFIPRDYARLGFYLVGPVRKNIVLPLEDKPTHFSHAGDVIVLGCSQDEYIEAHMVILTGEQGPVLLSSPKPGWVCDQGE